MLSEQERRQNDKESKHRHYLRNKDKYIAQALVKKKEMQEYVRQIKSTTPCVDCNIKYPWPCMDFDHLGEKIDNVARLVSKGNWKALLDEIAKCELVCSNCHRMRTAGRAGWEI